MIQQLPNPDNWPQSGSIGVTAGYQRQNTNIFAIQTGLDTTEPFDDGEGILTIPAGGIIECNGVLYKIISDITLPKPDIDTAYWIEVNTDESDLKLVTRPGKWSPEKQGCYTADNNRTLNWVSQGIIDNITEVPVFSESIKGEWNINPKKGWYYIEIASGLGGGDGFDGDNIISGTSPGAAGGGGGIINSNPNSIKKFSIFLEGNNYNIYIGGSANNGDAGDDGQFNSLTGGTGGGGGGGGGGESSSFNNILTKPILPGKGGNGGRVGTNINIGIGGRPGENGGTGFGAVVANVAAGGIGMGLYRGGGGGGGSRSANNTGAGGDGGDGGTSGILKPYGSEGGYCDVYLLSV